MKYPNTLSTLKSLKVLPVALGFLFVLGVDFSCSKPPAMIKLSSSQDAELNPDTDDKNGGEIGEDGEVDNTGEGEDVGETSDPNTGEVGEPTTGAPTMPMEEKFKPCVEQSEQCHPHVFILADEPLHKILLVNLDDPSKDWDLDIPGGARDLQLIGDNKVMVGTLDGNGGYHEVDITTGKITKSVTGVGQVNSVQRLANGHTLMMGPGLDGGKGLVVLEMDSDKKILSKKEYPDVRDGRMIRQTKAGTFLMGTSTGKTDADVMLEMSADGKELNRYPVNSWPAHFALRASNGDTIVATGHGKTIRIFDKDRKMKKEIGGPNADDAKEVNPNYSGHFFMLPNGNYILTNWQGHESNLGSKGRQIVEYNAEGKLVWWWKQDAKRISAVHSILVLDNLDLTKAYTDANGILEMLK